MLLPPLQKKLSFQLCLFVCLFVWKQHYSKRYEQIPMKFYEGVWGGNRKNWLNFGGDLRLLRWDNEQKTQ